MRKWILKGIGAVVVAAWLSLLLGMSLDIERGTWIVWVTAVALITEVAIWATAAVLGIAVLQARKAVWRWISRPFRRRTRS